MAWTQTDRAFKTLINRRTTDSTGKYWYNEFSDNTLNIHATEIWSQAIDSDPDAAVLAGVVEKRTLFTLTLDGTVPNNQCYYAELSGERLKDWVGTKYGEGYQVHLFDNSNAEIFPTDACQWFFDTQTGILTFNGSVASFAKPFKITGYRYIGSKGFASVTSGTSGTSGIDGTSGTSGTSGTDGSSGSSGSSGTDGSSGSSGTSGTSGTDGSSGTSGSSGIDGTSGSSGSSGTSGTDGSSGSSGTSGTSIAWKGAWTSAAEYKVSDIVSYKTSAYVCISDNTASTTNAPDGSSGSSTWALLVSSGTSGTSGTSGEGGTSGAGAGDGTIPMGDLPSGQTYNNGLVTVSDADHVNATINQINSILALIAPAKAGVLTNTNLSLSNTTKYSAKLPSGLDAAWYSDGSVAGATVTDYITDGTFRLTTPTPSTAFHNGQISAPGGTLSLFEGTTSTDTLSTATTGSSTKLTVTDVSTYNQIWSKANAYAEVNQTSEGYQTYQLKHTLAGNSNTTSVRFDNAATAPSFSNQLTVTEGSVVPKYLSGIQYYGQGTSLNISYTAASGIFQKAYHPTAVAVVSQNVGAFASFNQNPASTPAVADTFDIANHSVTLGVASKSSNLPSITVTLQKPDGQTATSTASLAKKVCTYGTVSSTTAESFFDEAQRLVVDTNTVWTSSNALTTGNAQVRNGVLQYPDPTDYAGFTGDQEYQRKFTKASASTGTLTFSGITYDQISPYGTGNLNILIQLDTDGQYFDLGKVVGDNNGNGSGTTRANSKGARSSGSGGAVSWSLGTFSTANNSSQFRIIIIFKNSTRSMTSITSA